MENSEQNSQANPIQMSFFERLNLKMKQSLTIKLLTIGFLVLLLLIPLNMVNELIYERQYRSDDAFREVSQIWGTEQTISGPVVTIPYKEIQIRKENDEEVEEVVIKYLQILPN